MIGPAIYRDWVLAAAVLLSLPGCSGGDAFAPPVCAAPVELLVGTGTAPSFEWPGCGAAGVGVEALDGSGQVMWSVLTVGTQNTLQSPVQYGQRPAAPPCSPIPHSRSWQAAAIWSPSSPQKVGRAGLPLPRLPGKSSSPDSHARRTSPVRAPPSHPLWNRRTLANYRSVKSLVGEAGSRVQQFTHPETDRVRGGSCHDLQSRCRRHRVARRAPRGHRRARGKVPIRRDRVPASRNSGRSSAG